VILTGLVPWHASSIWLSCTHSIGLTALEIAAVLLVLVALWPLLLLKLSLDVLCGL